MRKLYFRYLIFLLIGILLYLVHRFFLSPLYVDNQLDYLNFTYKFNAIFTLMVIGILHLVYKLDTDFMGFSLMLLGVLKILVYIAFLKRYEMSIEKSVFFHIFIPYLAGQSMEINAFLKIVKRSKPHTTNTIK